MTRALLLLAVAAALALAGCAGTQDQSTGTGDEGVGSSGTSMVPGNDDSSTCPQGPEPGQQLCPTQGGSGSGNAGMPSGG